jgi:serine/threonine-protein kinase
MLVSQGGSMDDPMATIVAPPGAGTASDAELARSWLTNEQVDRALLQVAAGTVGDLAAVLLAAGQIDEARAATLRRLPPARLVDSFELAGRIGAGAMGEVYRARDLRHGREAALKLVTGRLEDDPGFQRRFEREAKVLQGLDHPAIARCLGRGAYQGHPWMAMEFVRGPSLADLLASHGPLLQQHAVRLCRQVAEGLHHAWQNGQLVHRDIKPGNILVDRGGRDPAEGLCAQDNAKIIDFGLAKSAEGGSVSTVLTMAGTVLGTPAYMAPEQIEGRDTDCRADIYALGATLYHLLTGKVPYDGRSPAEVMTKHLHEPVQDPGRVVPALRISVRQLVMTAMAKAPDQRFKDPLAFAIAAQGCLDEMVSRSLKLVRKPLTTKVINKTPLPVAPPPAAAHAPTTDRHTPPGCPPPAASAVPLRRPVRFPPPPASTGLPPQPRRPPSAPRPPAAAAPPWQRPTPTASAASTPPRLPPTATPRPGRPRPPAPTPRRSSFRSPFPRPRWRSNRPAAPSTGSCAGPRCWWWARRWRW